MSAEFEANAVLSDLRQDAKLRHRRRYCRSRLARHRAELVKLRLAGASLAELQRWLRTSRRVKISRTSIFRFLRKLPELSNG